MDSANPCATPRIGRKASKQSYSTESHVEILTPFPLRLREKVPTSYLSVSLSAHCIRIIQGTPTFDGTVNTETTIPALA